MRNFIVSFLYLFPFFCLSQSNSWINSNQVYYKIPVAQTGVYRVTYNDLEMAGFPLSSVDPRLIQLFHRGVEQAIYFKHDQVPADARFDRAEYLEFFGQQNDGKLDADLYRPTSLQPHSYYNLYSDTTAYFLTWNFGATPGKRMSSFDEVNVNNIPKATFHYEERLLINTTQYSVGRTEGDLLQLTQFDQGEGWTGNAIRQGQFLEFNIDMVTQGVLNSGSPQLEMLLVGRDKTPHTAEILVGAGSGSLRLVATRSFTDFETVLVNLPLLWSDISATGRLVVRINAPPNTSTNRPQFSASYLKLTFPQNFNSAELIQKTFNLAANPLGKAYLEFENASSNLRMWDITDPATIVSIGLRTLGSARTAMVESTNSQRKLLAFTNTLSPAGIKKVSFRLFSSPITSNYIIISNRQLMKPAASYSDPVRAYAAYRASEVGGSYDTLVIPMDILYNQFNYGETSPRAIYEFMKFMVVNGKPKYLFLIGKGRDVYSNIHRIANSPANTFQDLVPSAGVPAADINFTAGLAGTTYEPAVPTGRLSASSPVEVANYLDKIKEFESSPGNETWHKRGLHLSGGIQAFEMHLFRLYVDEFRSTAEKEFWGASVKTIAKNEPSPIALINIADEINEGVNLVTFFGHSSPNNTDIDIGSVTDPVLGYKNAGKYPAFLINGCSVGSFFSNNVIFGENWINAANLGARNFIAHSSYGYASTFRNYSNLFYSIGFADSVFINKGIGDVQKEVARRYMQSVPPSFTDITQVQQMVLLGDPAVKLLPASKPDYEIANSLSLTSFDDKPVTALADSFAVKIVVKNLGLAKPDPLKIKVTRLLSNGTELNYDSVFPPVLYVDTILFKIYRKGETGGGTNTFLVHLDPDNSISELRENNNEASLNTFIALNEILNLFPRDYGIVNQNTLSLVWQSSDILSDTREFQLEVDTVLTFNSPFLVKKKVAGKVLAKASVELANIDSTVYYWRTRFDKSTNEESDQWVISSFSFIKDGAEGWAQLRKNQLSDNVFSGIIDQGEGKPFTFEETSTAISIITYGSNNPATNSDVSVKLNDSEFNLTIQGQQCRDNTLNLIAFNKSTSVPYAPIPFSLLDPRTCGRLPQLIDNFRVSEMETGQEDDLIAAINRIGMSDSVVLFSIGDAGYSSWSVAVKNKLGELGIELTAFNNLVEGEPIIIFAKKGAPPGSAKIIRSTILPANEQSLTAREQITGRKSSGMMKSVLIGPAQEWRQFINAPPLSELSDQVSFLIYGVDNTGKENLITDDAENGYDLSQVSVDEFPFLRIVFQTKDEINLTPADWKNWIVEFEPVPEGVLLFKGTTSAKVVQEGESWNTQFAFANITNKHFNDSLSLELEIVNRDNRIRSIEFFKIHQPAPNDTTFFNVASSTIGKSGVHDVNLFVNKRVIPEQYYDNNFASLPGYLIVKPDNTKPVLEVTFDGQRLRNGDFVSSTPLIQMSVKDENRFILKTDTLGMTILLRYPCDRDLCSFSRVPFSSPEIKWYPATSNSDFRVDFTPTNLTDGEYILSVQASDARGNLSGANPYLISFNVKSDTELNFNGVYPNPSSVGFFFKFELSGNMLPEEFSLKIYSSAGQLISEFGIEDVKQFYIGTNEIVWDGTDSTGKMLTNGVYIYRLQIKSAEADFIDTGKLIWIR